MPSVLLNQVLQSSVCVVALTISVGPNTYMKSTTLLYGVKLHIQLNRQRNGNIDDCDVVSNFI